MSRMEPRWYVHPNSPYRWVYSGIWCEQFVRAWHDAHDRTYHDHQPFELRSSPSTVDWLRFRRVFVESVGGDQVGPSGGTAEEFLYWFRRGVWPWENDFQWIRLMLTQGGDLPKELHLD